jgi:hypothetical protein
MEIPTKATQKVEVRNSEMNSNPVEKYERKHIEHFLALHNKNRAA